MYYRIPSNKVVIDPGVIAKSPQARRDNVNPAGRSVC